MENRVFQGKEAKNNELILKSLFEKGYLTPWKIANELAFLDPRKQDNFRKAQSIQSVLVRKNGRLSALSEKGFIEKTTQGYCLTFNKGFCTALTLYEKDIPKPAIDEAIKISSLLPELKTLLDIISQSNPEAMAQMYYEMRRITFCLLDKGINFNKITNEEFNDYFSFEYQRIAVEQMNKDSRNEKKWNPPPELKEAQRKFVSRLTVILQNEFNKQVQELEKLTRKYSLEEKGEEKVQS